MMANETSSNFSIISSTISASCTDSSDHKENAFMDYWIDGVLKICGGCFGSIMNAIAIWILVSEKRMQKMFLHILTCSLLFDNGYMLMEIITTMYWEFKVKNLVWILPHLAYPLKEIFYTANILTTIALSYERYTLLSDSKGYKQATELAECRYKRLRKYILGIALFSIVFNLPSFFTHVVSSKFDVCTNMTVYKPSKTDFRRDPNYKLLDKSIKWSIFLVISFSILIFFNWKLFVNVKDKLEIRKRLTTVGIQNEVKKPSKTGCVGLSMLKRMRKQEKFTTALFALITAFCLCNIWFLVECILKTVEFQDDATEEMVENFEIFSRLMRMLNSCTNVFIYCIVDRTFRTYFKTYLRRIASFLTCNLAPVNTEKDDSKTRVSETGYQSETQIRFRTSTDNF